MGKLPNVTAEELKGLDERGSDLCQELWGVHNRLEKGYADELVSPLALARSFLSLSRSAADVAALILGRAALQEMQRETEALLRARKPS